MTCEKHTVVFEEMSVTNPNAARELLTLKEQLRLFAFGEEIASEQDGDETLTTQAGLNKRQRLETLLEGELDFHGEDSSYASHDLHAFAAKFPPQLPRAFIRGLTVPGDVVLDPMMGSGTTVVEAVLEGRHGIGLDIDPLALRLGRVKTMPLDVDRLRIVGNQVLTRVYALLSDGDVIETNLDAHFDDQTRAFVNYWFTPTTQRELMALVLPIQEIEDAALRRFFELTFSSIIVTKSGGVSRARDLAHSRPHLDTTKTPKSALDQFALKLRKNLASIAQLETRQATALTLTGDARCMPLADCSVDLIVTSPPYANAIDYMRAHKFSLVWFGESVAGLSKLRADYIGSERVGAQQYQALPERPETIIQMLAALDPNKAAILRKYYIEMRAVLREIYRVLRHDTAAIVVVGTSTMRSIDVQTHHCLADIAATSGFEVVGVVQRKLDRNKRMMPARFGKKIGSMIEQRMHEEYVLGLFKS